MKNEETYLVFTNYAKEFPHLRYREVYCTKNEGKIDTRVFVCVRVSMYVSAKKTQAISAQETNRCVEVRTARDEEVTTKWRYTTGVLHESRLITKRAQAAAAYE